MFAMLSMTVRNYSSMSSKVIGCGMRERDRLFVSDTLTQLR